MLAKYVATGGIAQALHHRGVRFHIGVEHRADGARTRSRPRLIFQQEAEPSANHVFVPGERGLSLDHRQARIRNRGY